jgi:hypothetical protein
VNPTARATSAASIIVIVMINSDILIIIIINIVPYVDMHIIFITVGVLVVAVVSNSTDCAKRC